MRLESSVQNFSVTAEAEEIQVESSPEVGGHKENKFSASAKEEVLILSPLTFAVFGRDDYYRDQNLPGAGADAQLSINSSLSLFGGMSVSQRTPTLQELYWSSDSTHLPTPRLWLKNEQHTLIQVGTRFSISDFLTGTISLNHREIKNPILVDTTRMWDFPHELYSVVFTASSQCLQRRRCFLEGFIQPFLCGRKCNISQTTRLLSHRAKSFSSFPSYILTDLSIIRTNS